MSHWAQCRVEIEKVDEKVLDSAVRRLAERLSRMFGHDVKVVENDVVYGWGTSRRVKYRLTIRTPYGNGMGIDVENGKLVVVGDDHGAPITVHELSKLLNQEYAAAAIEMALAQLGMRVDRTYEGEEIRLVAHVSPIL